MVLQQGYTKPLPNLTPVNRPFWEGTKRREVLIQRCRKCENWIYPISPVCPTCWSEEYDWTRLSGKGNISSWTVYYQSFHPGFTELPYAVIQVDLEEGMRFISNPVDIAPDELRAGMPVEATFDDVTPEITLVKFRRAR